MSNETCYVLTYALTSGVRRCNVLHLDGPPGVAKDKYVWVEWKGASNDRTMFHKSQVAFTVPEAVKIMRKMVEKKIMNLKKQIDALLLDDATIISRVENAREGGVE